MSEQIESGVELTRDGNVATIRINRPESRNALSPQAMEALSEFLSEVAETQNDRVLILTGGEGAFCSGADLSGGGGETSRQMGRGPIALGQFTRRALDPALKLHRMPKPTIAAVNGVAAGAGCNLALGCDIVFASESGRFSEVFVNRGLTLDYGGSWLLPRLIGLQRAKDLAFRGDVIGADQALEMGLVLGVLPDGELMEHVKTYAEMLAAKPPIALSMIKAGLNAATTSGYEDALEREAEAQATCLGSKDFRAAMIAWLKKEPGEFTGS
jgi:enoyl-CoA hydratase/carnithine racemase